jgi:hypothetical protein
MSWIGGATSRASDVHCSWPALLTIVVVAASFAHPQEPPSIPQFQPNNDIFLKWSDVEKNIWLNAKPYLDDQLPELEVEVPELKGFEPAASQEQLSFILSGVGQKCVHLLRRTPNVISNETVITRTPPSKVWQQKFGYLMLYRETPSGIVLEEYRTDSHGHSLPNQPLAGPFSQGFASMWVRLLPANQRESRFRYLGQEEMDKHKTFVLGFAQLPDKVKFPGQFMLAGSRISILYQGIVWIDSSDFRIVRMREDLLAPRPDADLEKFSAEVLFNEVHIPKATSSLWLPGEAIVEWKFKGQFAQQRHVYSHYRLYGVTTRILPGI